MKPLIFGRMAALLAGLLLVPEARAFPPAPDGLIYGMVKDQYGTPLKVCRRPGDPANPRWPANRNHHPTQSGRRYEYTRPRAPMDARHHAPGPIATNAYRGEAAPYMLLVVVGTTTNLPIEMTGASPQLGQPSQMTLQNLTLGVDANGDGIPDAWETLFLGEIGTNLDLASVNPSTDYAHDGRTLLQEYLLGNYPYNPTNTFAITIASQNAGSAVLQFTNAVDRPHLHRLRFGRPPELDAAFLLGARRRPRRFKPPITQSKNQPVQIQTVQPANAPQVQFFRLQLQ